MAAPAFPRHIFWVILVDSVIKDTVEESLYLFKMAGLIASEETTFELTGGEFKKPRQLTYGGFAAIKKINVPLKKINKKRAELNLPPASVIISTLADNYSMRVKLVGDVALVKINEALEYHEPKREAGNHPLSTKEKAWRKK